MVFAKIPFEDHTPIIDFGCGQGHWTRELEKRFPDAEIVGIDIAEEFINEATERDKALSMCLSLISTCSEVQVFGERITAGMQTEIKYAEDHGVPVSFVNMEVM